MSESNITKGWKKTGLFPRDPARVLSKLKVKSANQIELSILEGAWKSSALRESNAKAIRNLLKSVLGSNRGKEAQILPNTLEDTFTRITILRIEKQGLITFGNIEKSRRRRGKGLIDLNKDENSCKARVYTLSKVKAQILKRQEQDEAKKTEELHKEQKKKEQLQKKQDKERGIQDRKYAKEIARVQKEKEVKGKQRAWAEEIEALNGDTPYARRVRKLQTSPKKKIDSETQKVSE
ncbi:hypothetical protein EJ08DRAFT_658538 [Tothia fuscella]|uniref:Uncharacterized protein n=1 Tax=Tothia fuscella TaxID=1048955 RepID=A0A9P4NV68_9PEZI|nr:hypothetical protein EJ08DRAFT_658538 [Tothia fuscella]